MRGRKFMYLYLGKRVWNYNLWVKILISFINWEIRNELELLHS